MDVLAKGADNCHLFTEEVKAVYRRELEVTLNSLLTLRRRKNVTRAVEAVRSGPWAGSAPPLWAHSCTDIESQP